MDEEVVVWGGVCLVVDGTPPHESRTTATITMLARTTSRPNLAPYSRTDSQSVAGE